MIGHESHLAEQPHISIAPLSLEKNDRMFCTAATAGKEERATSETHLDLIIVTSDYCMAKRMVIFWDLDTSRHERRRERERYQPAFYLLLIFWGIPSASLTPGQS